MAKVSVTKRQRAWVRFHGAGSWKQPVSSSCETSAMVTAPVMMVEVSNDFDRIQQEISQLEHKILSLIVEGDDPQIINALILQLGERLSHRNAAWLLSTGFLGIDD